MNFTKMASKSGSDYRIVSEWRGEYLHGIRVQKRSTRSMLIWSNTGPRCYTMEDARRLRAYYESKPVIDIPRITVQELE